MLFSTHSDSSCQSKSKSNHQMLPLKSKSLLSNAGKPNKTKTGLLQTNCATNSAPLAGLSKTTQMVTS